MSSNTKAHLLFLGLGALLLTLVACSTPEPTATPIPPTATVTPLPPTETPVPPTATPVPPTEEAEAVVEGFVVTFDESGCKLSTPPELPVGDYRFVLNIMTDEYQGLAVCHLRDGHTIQDMLDLQSEPGVWFPKPSWAVYTLSTMEWDAANDTYVYTHSLDKEGEYSVAVGADSPPSWWFCGSLDVIEAPSE